MKEIVISSFEDFIEKTFKDSFDKKIHRHRSNFVFRGLSKSEWKLITSLQRNCEDLSEDLEKNLIRNFGKYASKELSFMPGIDNDWKSLTVGQHHGLPTRLLDWTYSPLVALHFATENINHLNEDAVVFMLDLNKVKGNLPQSVKMEMESVDSFVLTEQMLSKSFNRIADFDGTQNDDFIAFFEPAAIDSRIINQFGLFSISNGANVNLNEMVEKNEGVRLIIPKNIRMQLRDYLDQMNINERILFPGLDGLASWLQRHYKPYQVWEKK